MRSCAAAAMIAALLMACVPAGPSADAPARGVTALVLGVAQDGGVPHLGCTRACCQEARRDPSRAHRVASLGLIVEHDGVQRLFLVDATPDLRSQVDTLLAAAGDPERPAGLPLDGILLTHAHVGHYAGLIYLGRESLAARQVPLYASERMGGFLSANGPWKRLVDGKHVALRPLRAGEEVTLAPGLTVMPMKVAHREEESDALGFLFTGPSKRLLYIPDIDAWERWDQDILAVVSGVDVALLDGSFHGLKELPDRAMEEIPHPPIPASMDRLQPAARAGKRIVFIHLNHSNPALQPGSPERQEIERRGFTVAADGLRIPL